MAAGGASKGAHGRRVLPRLTLVASGQTEGASQIGNNAWQVLPHVFFLPLLQCVVNCWARECRSGRLGKCTPPQSPSPAPLPAHAPERVPGARAT